MQNYVKEGKVLRLVAPVGGVTSGTPVVIGGMFVIPMDTADATETFSAYCEGVFSLTKATGYAPDAGDAAYFDDTTEEVEGTDATDNRRIGVFSESAISGATTCYVRLDGISFGDGNDDVEAKANTADLASTSNGYGASLIGIEDAAGDYTATDAEAALAEVKVIADAAAPTADLASVANGEGAALVGIEDSGAYYTATTVEGALAEGGATMTKVYSAAQIDWTGSNGAGYSTITVLTTGYTPAAGDMIVFCENDVDAEIGTDLTQALVDDGGTIKVQQLSASDWSAETFVALVFPVYTP